MENDSDESKTIWDGRICDELERANWFLKGIQGQLKKGRTEKERDREGRESEREAR